MVGDVNGEFVVGLAVGVLAATLNPVLGLLILVLLIYAIYSKTGGRRFR